MRVLLKCLMIAFVTLFVACKSHTKGDKKKNISDWENGTAHIQADTNLRPLLDQIVPIYAHFHPNSKLIIDYKAEDNIIQDFKDNKTKIMVVSTDFDPKEIEYLQAMQKGNVNQYTFGFDAIAVIANKSNPDSVFNVQQMGALLQSKKTDFVFDNAKSGIAKTMLEKAKLTPEQLKSALVINKLEDVVNYVATHPQSLGFIPFSLISYQQDAYSKSLKDKIKIMGVTLNDTTYYLSQENIAMGNYPLYRPMTLLVGNTDEVNALGFARFLMKQQVSKILLKSGVVPTVLPNRLYEYTEEFDPEGQSGKK